MKFFEIAIDGDSFMVDEHWAGILRATAERAAAHSVALHGDLSDMIDVKLIYVGPKVIGCTKEVRTVTGLNLKDAKAVVDKVRGNHRYPFNGNTEEDGAPQSLGVFSYDEALKLKARFEAVGSRLDVPSPLEALAEVAE